MHRPWCFVKDNEYRLPNVPIYEFSCATLSSILHPSFLQPFGDFCFKRLLYIPDNLDTFSIYPSLDIYSCSSFYSIRYALDKCFRSIWYILYKYVSGQYSIPTIYVYHKWGSSNLVSAYGSRAQRARVTNRNVLRLHNSRLRDFNNYFTFDRSQTDTASSQAHGKKPTARIAEFTSILH